MMLRYNIGNNFFSLSRNSKSVGALVFISLSLFLISQKSDASTGSKWTLPSSDERGSSNHSLSRASRDPDSSVSPFSPGSNNLALDLGQVFLMGGLTKYDDSIGTQLHYTYGVSDLFGFDSSLGYSQHSNGQFSMASALAGLRMNLSWYDKIIPYMTAGLGFYRPSYSDPTAPAANPSSLSALLFGMHIGPGIDLELNRSLFFGASATINTMFGTTQNRADNTPFTLGGTYTTFLLHMGATF